MVLVYIFAIIWAILQIILFFKVWGMTNDVEKILNCLQNENIKKVDCGAGVATNVITEDMPTGFVVGALVVDKDDCQWRIIEFENNTIRCKNSTKGIKDFCREDLKLF